MRNKIEMMVNYKLLIKFYNVSKIIDNLKLEVR
jgi:hypothetical protein